MNRVKFEIINIIVKFYSKLAKIPLSEINIVDVANKISLII